MTSARHDLQAPALLRRLDHGGPSARSLLLTVLGEYVLASSEPVWTAALIGVLAEFDVAEKTARQAVARAAAEGWIAGQRQGRLVRWALTDSGRKLLTEGAQRIYSFGQEHIAWDGRWLVLMITVPQSARDVRHRLRTRLAWAGLGPLPSGIWICPDPGREAEVATILADLGLDAGAMSFVASHGSIGTQSSLVGLAWDLAAVEASYQEFIDTFTAPEPATGAQALTAQTLLVHEWRRFPFIDPQLPRELLPAAWLGTQAADLFRARHGEWRGAATEYWNALASGAHRD
jgi:phenylacetic acid degradation operon negative regulatory protein